MLVSLLGMGEPGSFGEIKIFLPNGPWVTLVG